jgi:ribosomal protein L17
MEDKNLKRPEENAEETKPQMHVNEYGETKDSAVVVEEADRTVLLTEGETIIIPKETMIDVPPKNRERKIYAGMWGTTELVTVGLAMLAILTTILVFVLLVLPAQRELNNNRAKRDDLDKQLTTAKLRYGNITTTEERVKEIIKSVDDFESNHLSVETNGKAALAQQLNGLITAYGLTNTSGPDYAALEIKDPNRSNQDSEAEKGRSKFISIYPGQYITMTLDGSYQNLRRFIREIETSNQFVVISAIELEPSENKEKENDSTNPQPASVNNQPTGSGPTGINQTTYSQPGFPQANPQQPQTAAKIDRGKTRGETVTLRLELAAYFRRPNFQPQAASLER